LVPKNAIIASSGEDMSHTQERRLKMKTYYVDWENEEYEGTEIIDAEDTEDAVDQAVSQMPEDAVITDIRTYDDDEDEDEEYHYTDMYHRLADLGMSERDFM
jgi:hypothetical protein